MKSRSHHPTRCSFVYSWYFQALQSLDQLKIHRLHHPTHQHLFLRVLLIPLVLFPGQQIISIPLHLHQSCYNRNQTIRYSPSLCPNYKHSCFLICPLKRQLSSYFSLYLCMSWNPLLSFFLRPMLVLLWPRLKQIVCWWNSCIGFRYISLCIRSWCRILLWTWFYF